MYGIILCLSFMAFVAEELVFSYFFSYDMFYAGGDKIKKAFYVSLGIMGLNALLSVLMWIFSRFVLIPLGLRTAVIRIFSYLIICAAVCFLLPVILKKVKHSIARAAENHRVFLFVNNAMIGITIQVMHGEFDLAGSFMWSVKGTLFFMTAAVVFAGMVYKIEKSSYKQFMNEFYLKFLTALLMCVACAGFWSIG